MTEGSGSSSAPAPSTATAGSESSSPATPESGGSVDQGTPILGEADFPAAEGNTPASPDQPQSQQGDRILGRFDSYEQLEESWKQLNDIVRGRTSDISDEQLKNMVVDRGLMEESQMAATVPDSYDLQGAGFITEGYDPADVATINEAFKSVGLTEEQFGVVTKLGKAAIDDSLRMFGIGRNPEVEKAQLYEIWGDKTDTIGQSIKNFCKGHVPRDVWLPLMRTANGVKALKKYMDSVTGQRNAMVPQLGENFRGGGGGNSGNVESQKAKLRSHPAYSNPLHPQHNRIHEQYRSLPVTKRKDF